MFALTSFFSDISLFFGFPRTLAHSVREVLTSLAPPVTPRLQAAAAAAPGEQPGLNRLSSSLLTPSCPKMCLRSTSGESHRGLLTLDNVANMVSFNRR